MADLTLSDEQLALVASGGPIAVRDQTGVVRGYVQLIGSNEEILDAKRTLASSGRLYTTAEVLQEIKSRARP